MPFKCDKQFNSGDKLGFQTGGHDAVRIANAHRCRPGSKASNLCGRNSSRYRGDEALTAALAERVMNEMLHAAHRP